MHKIPTQKSVDWPKAIKSYRESKGLTVLQFARGFEVSPQAVYMWENGKREAPYRVTEEVLNWMVEATHA